MRFASLGSGSHGNATIVEVDDATVLIDIGFTLRETEARLRRLGKQPEDIGAVLVTHEHGDHIHGVAPFARKYGCEVFLTAGTYSEEHHGGLAAVTIIDSHVEFRLGSATVRPIPVPHDANEPCQYLLSDGSSTFGILTDLGFITAFVRDRYQACDALLLECNHDLKMLAGGPYSFALKNRIASTEGHLSNDQAASFVAELDLSRLQCLVLSHLSEVNNTPALALETISAVTQAWCGELLVASQGEGTDWVSVSPGRLR